MTAQYYLHTNGEMIYKPHGGVDYTSDFVKHVWEESEFAPTPFAYVKMMTQAYQLGANPERLHEMAERTQLRNYIEKWEEVVFKNGLDCKVGLDCKGVEGAENELF